MLAEHVRVSSAPPDWPNCDQDYRRYFPDKMEGGIKRLVEHGHLTLNEVEDIPLTGRLLGSYALGRGLGPFYRTKIFSDLQIFCDDFADGGWETTSAFITGGSGYDIVASHFRQNEYDFSQHHWYLEMVGREPHWRRGMDVDIWITEQGFEHMKEESNFSRHVGIETQSRTVNGLKLLFIGEKTSSHWLRFQFHTIEGSNLSPMAQCMLLAPTNLHRTGVAINKGNMAAVDPEAALHTGPWYQKPPMHLIDADNPLIDNRGRILNGLMIYTLMTPKLNSKKYSDEYKEIRKYVSDNLDKLSLRERNVFLEKLAHWHHEIPWNDYIGDCVFKAAEKLAITGFMPKIFDWILQSENEDYINGFLYEILEYAEYLKMPEVAGLYIPECNPDDPKYGDLAIKIVRKIDWLGVATKS